MKKPHTLFTHVAMSFLIWGCSESAPVLPEVEFSKSLLTVSEGEEATIALELSDPIPVGVSIKISMEAETDHVYGEGDDFFVSPAPVANVITLTGPLTIASFEFHSNFDTRNEVEEHVTFSLTEVSGIDLGTNQAITVSVVDGTLSDGLVAEYVFDGDLLDTSGKGNHGTNHGATLTAGKSGNPNTGYSFDGSDYMTVANNADINFNTAQNFTVSLWTQPAATQNDMAGIVNDIIRQWVGDAQGYPFGISYYNSSAPNPNTLAGVRYDGSACANIPQIISGSVNTNFHHIVFMRNNSLIYLYVDNVLAGSIADTTVCNTSNISDLVIGCRGNLLRCFTGKIDDIRIYNRVLNGDEVAGLYNMP